MARGKTTADEIDEALAMDEPAIAEALLEQALAAARKKGAAATLQVLRRRASVALDEAIDDDLEDLGQVARKVAELASHPGAGACAREDHAFALLLSGATGRARKATAGDRFTAAAIAWCTLPSPKAMAALLAEAGDDPGRLERLVRLVLQRMNDRVAEHAERLVARRRESSPPWDRPVARAVKLHAVALRVEGDAVRAEKVLRSWMAECESGLPDGDPRRAIVESARAASAPPAQAMAARSARLARLASRFGETSPLVEPALWALSSDAVRAGAHEVAVDALERLDGVLGPRRGAKVLQDRRSVLRDLRRSLLALGRFEEAGRAVDREEAVLARLGQPVPAFLARAEIAYARGDLDAWVGGHQAELARCEAGVGPVFGPDGSTTRVVRAWTRQAEEKVAVERGSPTR